MQGRGLKHLIFICFFVLEMFANVTAGQENLQQNSQENLQISQEQNLQNEQELQIHLAENLNKITSVDQEIEKNGFWVKRYYDHLEYEGIKAKITDLEKTIKKERTKRQTKDQTEKIQALEVELSTARSKLSLLGEIGENPYTALIKVDEIQEAPEITNPFSVIAGLSYLSELAAQKQDYFKRLHTLSRTINSLNTKKDLLETSANLYSRLKDKENLKKTRQNLASTMAIITTLSPVYDIFKTTLAVFEKKLAQIEAQLTTKITAEAIKGLKILIFVLVLFALMFVIKLVVKKTVEDSNRAFNMYRVVNITGFVIIVLTITFSYINNLTYFITVLGFVSAGIAIAMKDWFMNMLGWFVIVLGGSIHVGDRIKITKEGGEYVGDVLEISLTRVTFLEDITLTSYTTNRRTGRVIMFPNNFIFNSVILNYTFSGLKTVWDGIDIMVTFTSNHKKAAHIAKEIVQRYSKGYSDITRKQINELRGTYHIRNFNSDPRVFTFIETYGVKISAWYLTNAYATLTLRSTISSEIVEAFNKASDIKIAYPSQTLMLSSQKPNIPNYRI